jgi:phosphoglycolate phosphatase-like HAD superfamily hydrolase
VPGAKKFLDHFYREIALFVASGTPDEEIREIVARRGMSHYFVSIHGAPATKEEIINNICNSHSFDRKRVLMVGDALADYDGAVKTGVCFIGRVHEGRSPFPESVVVIEDLQNLSMYI